MKESNLQNFEINQESVVPPSPVTKRNKLVYILVPVAIFLVVLALLTTILMKGRSTPQLSISTTPAPQNDSPTPTPELQISTTSAFFQYVASISAIQKDLDTVDLQESSLTPPKLDLKVSFEEE